ncbi:hypothetical protein LPJ81_004040 [Coemansia sp. IMI 209127]|nr:hypothetical protein LPJ81_004040 [Coemansia sp. IMI 209127]
MGLTNVPLTDAYGLSPTPSYGAVGLGLSVGGPAPSPTTPQTREFSPRARQRHMTPSNVAIHSPRAQYYQPMLPMRGMPAATDAVWLADRHMSPDSN